jgi:hypothetical protein
VEADAGAAGLRAVNRFCELFCALEDEHGVCLS